jgi:hypothetical protein
MPTEARQRSDLMIVGSFGHIGHDAKSENTSQSRRLTIDATIQL